LVWFILRKRQQKSQQRITSSSTFGELGKEYDLNRRSTDEEQAEQQTRAGETYGSYKGTRDGFFFSVNRLIETQVINQLHLLAPQESLAILQWPLKKATRKTSLFQTQRRQALKDLPIPSTRHTTHFQGNHLKFQPIPLIPQHLQHQQPR
jgi:hypothetical protein